MDFERRLTTVLFTDIVGSTEHAARIGDHGWQDLLAAHHELVRAELERFGGREMNTVGDGFVAAFDDPERALRCACAIRDQVESLELEVRCGLHTGEVQRSAKALGGIAVHIAARLVHRAAPGEVLVSQTLRDLVVGSGFGFADRGVHELKGVPDTWRLFAVSSEPVRLDVASPWERVRVRISRAGVRRLLALGIAVVLVSILSSVLLRRESPTRRAAVDVAVAEGAATGIAVLPFTVTGSGVGELREGMVDLLATNLDGIGGLRTIDSRTVMARWRESVKGAEAPDLARTLEVARRTGARYALVGSAVSIGDRARLDVDVYELAGGSKIGHGRIEGAPDSLFAVVDRLSVDVLRAILEQDRKAVPGVSLASVTTDSLRALRAYLEGESAFRRSDFEAAIAAYRQAVEIDPTFALAYLRLATAYFWSEDIASGEPYAVRAAGLAARLSERDALLVRATLAFFRGAPDGLEFLRRAVHDYPDDPDAWFLMGETAYHFADQALLSPEEYRQAFRQAVTLDPAFAPAYLHLVSDAFFRGDSADAARQTRTYGALAPGTLWDRLDRLALRVAWGAEADRRLAIAELDSLGPTYVASVAQYLWNPRFHDVQEKVLRSVARPDDVWGRTLTRLRFHNAVHAGRLERGTTLLRARPRPGDPDVALLYEARAWGLPVPDAALDRTMPASPGAFPEDASAFFAGAIAVDRARWDEHAVLVSEARAASARLLAAGDSTAARLAAAQADALTGYAAWRQGRREDALRSLADAQRRLGRVHDPLDPPLIESVLRIWLATLLTEQGRDREAASYLRSFWMEPLAELPLARLEERLGDASGAARDYGAFLEAWTDPDPKLGSWVRDARAGLTRVSGGTPAEAPSDSS